MTFKGSEAGQSESATSPEATREPKGAAKKFRIWVIAGSSILLLGRAQRCGRARHSEAQ